MTDNDECGAVGGITGKGKKVRGENLLQWHFVHHKYHMALVRTRDRRDGKTAANNNSISNLNM
jgi:hypothetical protein